MQVIAAIDVGSNGIKMAIGKTTSADRVEIVRTFREAVRLGEDVFREKFVTDLSTRRLISAFSRFKLIANRYGASSIRAVATSAMREARNADAVIRKVRRSTGIAIEIIGGDDEARLVHLAASRAVDLNGKLAMLIDMGGGSVEIMLLSGGRIIDVESLKLGSVRLLRMLDAGNGGGEVKFHKLVREYTSALEKRLGKKIPGGKIGVCAGTGGNIESLASLRQKVLGKPSQAGVTAAELGSIAKKLQSMPYAHRVTKLGLRHDRADVIVPAAIVLHSIMKSLRVKRIVAPGVGLKEGLLYDYAVELGKKRQTLNRDQVMAAASQIGKKYFYDEKHARIVATHAVRLFEKTLHIHYLAENNKLLLEAAAMLHDIGNYVNVSSHHKHSYYIINATPFVGLTNREKEIVANVARYHRKSHPNQRHPAYKVLPAADRVIVNRLAAILRIANAMDVEHAGRVSTFWLRQKGKNVIISLSGKGDLLLEKWAIREKGLLFEQLYNLKLSCGKKNREQA